MKAVPKPVKKRKVKKITEAAKIKAIDAATREIVLRRDRVCILCGGTDVLQWSHLISRRRISVRWDLRNSAMMCRACHARHHKQGPEEYTLWFLRVHGVAEYEALVRKAAVTLSPAERRALIERFYSYAKRLTDEG